MNELALFAGAGCGILGSKLLGWRTVCYVENKSYPVEVLKARIRDGYLDDAPIWDDIRTFDGRPWAGSVDIVTAGFPCQPYSMAGKREGEKDERNLWPDTLRVIREVKPDWVLLENVPGLLSFPYIRRIFGDLAESGYDARWDCIPAAYVGAPHLRYRLWIVSHTNSQQGRLQLQRWENDPEIGRRSQDVSNAQSKRCETSRNSRERGNGFENIYSLCDTPGEGLPDRIGGALEGSQEGNQVIQPERSDWWAIEPGLGRVAHGTAHRVDRLAAIGNGQVPGVVRKVWDLLNNDFGA